MSFQRKQRYTNIMAFCACFAFRNIENQSMKFKALLVMRPIKACVMAQG
jgi:hypothetical protein